MGLTEPYKVGYKGYVVDRCGKQWDNYANLWITIMFTGEYKHTIDTKKRLSLPSKFRKELGQAIIVTKGIDSCLVIYSKKEGELMFAKLGNLPESKIEARSFARIKLAGASEITLDKLGRILIPDYLKEYASLKKNVVVCGLYNRIEIWNDLKWEKYRTAVEKKVVSMVSKLEELGI